MVRARFANMVVVVWAFVALPVVCETGLLEHLCDCVLGAVCEHESECDNDPCNTVATRIESQSGVELPAAVVWSATPEAEACRGRLCRVCSSVPYADANLPFPVSDRPLLI